MTSTLVLCCLVLTCVLAAVTCRGYDRDSGDISEFNQDSEFDDSVFDVAEAGSNDVMPSPGDWLDAVSRCSCNVKTGCLCFRFLQWKYGIFRIKINLRVTVRMSLLPGGGAYLIFNMNGKNVYFSKIDLRIPPRPCSRVPTGRFKRIVSRSFICLELKNISVAARRVCPRITGYIRVPFRTIHVYAEFGCMTLPKPRDVDQEMALDTSHWGDLDLEDIVRSPVDMFEMDDMLLDDEEENGDEQSDDADEDNEMDDSYFMFLED